GQEAGRAGLLPDRRAQAVAGIPDEALPGAGPHRAVFGHVLSHSGMVTSVTMFPARITGHHYFSKLIAVNAAPPELDQRLAEDALFDGQNRGVRVRVRERAGAG